MFAFLFVTRRTDQRKAGRSNPPWSAFLKPVFLPAHLPIGVLFIAHLAPKNALPIDASQ
jgi:hypothetical protein